MSGEQTTLHLILSPSAEGMSVYLGPLGPLRVSLWRSTATDDGVAKPAITLSRQTTVQSETTSAFPGGTEHILIVVELPSRQTIDAKTKELSDNTGGTLNGPTDDNAVPGDVQANDESSFWLQHDEPMTGQSEDVNEQAVLPETAEQTIEQGQTEGETVDQSLRTLEDQSVQDHLAQGTIDLIDPDLRGSLADVEGQTTEVDDGKAEVARLPVVAHLPQQSNGTKTDPLALPLVLIRPTDGVGFCLSKGVSVTSGGDSDEGRMCQIAV